MPGPVSPRISCLSRRSFALFTAAVWNAMHTLCSVVGLPSQENFVASKRAPGAPVRGPSATSRAMTPIAVPSFGAAL
ncbi:hypothetical protein D3C83_175750 [compost metagenome]